MANLGNVTQQDLVRIRDLVISDPLALDRWPRVVDHIVNSAADERRVKVRWKRDDDFEEAILQSLRLWHGYGDQRADLLRVLRAQGLNTLANAVQELKFGLQGPGSGGSPPVWFKVGEVVHNFTGREAEVKQLHEMLIGGRSNESSLSNVVYVCGFGGVGKSMLARRYAFTFRRFYGGNVIWIHGETVVSMTLSFEKLAGFLELTPGEEIPAAAAVYENLKKRAACLFIFDNVQEKEHVKQFLHKITNPHDNAPHTLVTTRRNDLARLPENNRLLEELSVDESVQLIQRHLPRCSVEDGRRLANKLGRIPLALHQAVAYIRDKYVDGDGVYKYLEEWDNPSRQQQLAVLNDMTFQEESDYRGTILSTWKETLVSIEEMNKSAMELLQILSHLFPGRISLEFLNCLSCCTDCGPSLKILEKFSIVRIEGGWVRINCALQYATRAGMDPAEGRLITHLILQSIKSRVKQYFQSPFPELLPHALHLVKCQLDRPEPEYVTKEVASIVQLCYGFPLLGGVPEDCLLMAQEAAEMLEKVHGFQHESAVEMRSVVMVLNRMQSVISSYNDAVNRNRKRHANRCVFT